MVRSLSSTSSKTLDKGRTRGLARVAVAAVPSYKETRNKHKLSANFYFCDNHKLVESRLLFLSHHGSRIKIFHEYWSVQRCGVSKVQGDKMFWFCDLRGKSRTRKKKLWKKLKDILHTLKVSHLWMQFEKKSLPCLTTST